MTPPERPDETVPDGPTVGRPSSHGTVMAIKHHGGIRRRSAEGFDSVVSSEGHQDGTISAQVPAAKP